MTNSLQVQAGGERAAKALLDGERTLREKAERQANDFREILISLAMRFAGERYDAVRRQDQTEPLRWTPGDWKAFFGPIASPSIGDSWGEAASEDASLVRDLRKRLDEYQAENASLKKNIEFYQNTVAKKDQEIEDLQKSKEHNQGRGSNSLQTAITIKKTVLSGPVAAPGLRGIPADMTPAVSLLLADVEYVVSQLPPNPPAEFAKILVAMKGNNPNSLYYERMSAALRLIGRWGLYASLEIETIIMHSNTIGAKSGPIRRVLDKMVETHLAQEEKMSMETPKTTLMLMFLTERGRRIYQVLFGEDPKSSGHECLLQLASGDVFHAAALVALHARSRGWMVRMDPGPVVVVRKDLETHRLPILIEGETAPHPDPESNGKIAFCARTPEQRTLLADIYRSRNISGAATDIQTLVKIKPYSAITEKDTLWFEAW